MTFEMDYSILMSTADQRTWYPLRYVNPEGEMISCVSTYTIYSGANNPFEYVKIVLTKQDLSKMAPNLKTVEPGKNLLTINAVGNGLYTVTSCKYSDKKYTLTAYSNADKIRRYTYPETKELSAEEHIKYILSAGTFGVKYGPQSLVWRYSSERYDSSKIKIPKGYSVWSALQICAMMMGCRVFFSDGKAYIVGWTTSPQKSQALDFDVGNWDYTLIGNVNQGNIGSNTVTNYITGRCRDDGKDISVTVCGRHVTDAQNHIFNYEPAISSEHVYDRREGGTYDISILDAKQARKWLENMLDYMVEAQVDISFKLNENRTSSRGLEWNPHFSPYECVYRIQSYIDEVDVSADSSIGVSTGTTPVSKEVLDPETNTMTTVTEQVPDGINAKKLLLSAAERNYPEGFSEYTFGQVKNISLSNSTSEIFSSLGTRMTNLTK